MRGCINKGSFVEISVREVHNSHTLSKIMQNYLIAQKSAWGDGLPD